MTRRDPRARRSEKLPLVRWMEAQQAYAEELQRRAEQDPDDPDLLPEVEALQREMRYVERLLRAKVLRDQVRMRHVVPEG